MSATMPSTPSTDAYRTQRDTLVPSAQYVFVTPREGLPEGAQVKIARLTLKKTLRFSKLLDRIGKRDEVLEVLQGLGTLFGMTEFALPDNAAEMTQEEIQAYLNERAEEQDQQGLINLVLGINRIIAVLDPEDVIELYAIITEADPTFIDEFWDIDWGIEAVRLAFQQPGFQKLIGRFRATGDSEDSAGEVEPADGVEGNSTTVEEVSTPSSTSFNGPTVLPTNTFSN